MDLLLLILSTNNSQERLEGEIRRQARDLLLASRSNPITLFFCPLPLCRFNTTKEGIKKGAAARQLKIEHKVTDAMMTNSPEGSYRFKKDKQEN